MSLTHQLFTGKYMHVPNYTDRGKYMSHSPQIVNQLKSTCMLHISLMGRCMSRFYQWQTCKCMHVPSNKQLAGSGPHANEPDRKGRYMSTSPPHNNGHKQTQEHSTVLDAFRKCSHSQPHSEHKMNMVEYRTKETRH